MRPFEGSCIPIQTLVNDFHNIPTLALKYGLQGVCLENPSIIGVQRKCQYAYFHIRKPLEYKINTKDS